MKNKIRATFNDDFLNSNIKKYEKIELYMSQYEPFNLQLQSLKDRIYLMKQTYINNKFSIHQIKISIKNYSKINKIIKLFKIQHNELYEGYSIFTKYIDKYEKALCLINENIYFINEYLENQELPKYIEILINEYLEKLKQNSHKFIIILKNGILMDNIELVEKVSVEAEYINEQIPKLFETDNFFHKTVKPFIAKTKLYLNQEDYYFVYIKDLLLDLEVQEQKIYIAIDIFDFEEINKIIKETNELMFKIKNEIMIEKKTVEINQKATKIFEHNFNVFKFLYKFKKEYFENLIVNNYEELDKKQQNIKKLKQSAQYFKNIIISFEETKKTQMIGKKKLQLIQNYNDSLLILLEDSIIQSSLLTYIKKWYNLFYILKIFEKKIKNHNEIEYNQWEKEITSFKNKLNNNHFSIITFDNFKESQNKLKLFRSQLFNFIFQIENSLICKHIAEKENIELQNVVNVNDNWLALKEFLKEREKEENVQ